MTLAGNLSYSIAENFTIQIWVRPSNNGADQTILEKKSHDGSHKIVLSIVGASTEF